MSFLRGIVSAKLITGLVAIAAIVTAGTVVAVHESGSGVGACNMDPSGVTNQQVSGQNTRAADVTWSPPQPTSCGVVDHYNIVAMDDRGHPRQVMTTAPASADTAKVLPGSPNLNRCTWYRFGVQTVMTSGQSGSVIPPDHPVFSAGLPDVSPPLITIIVPGTANSGPSDKFDPAAVSACSSPDGIMPAQNPDQPPSLQNLSNNWLNNSPDNKRDPSTMDSGVGKNLIDSLAATGGYVLPFSYTSAVMLGPATSPEYAVENFTTSDVANANPMGYCRNNLCRQGGKPPFVGQGQPLGEPPQLNATITSIHETFPHTPILVIGHSLGGLIAEQWWLQYSNEYPDHDGVIQVISLDSPLNGVRRDASFAGSLSGMLGGTVVGSDPANAYHQLWEHQQDPACGTWDIYTATCWANSQTALALDNQNHLFTAIGDNGDPLYDVLDHPVSFNDPPGTPYMQRHPGLYSQVFWSDPQCAQPSFFDRPGCHPAGQVIVDPCGHKMNDYDPNGFGLGDSIWIHSNVKNCPQLISDALGWYHQYVQAHPTPTLTPTAQCTAFSSACPDSPSPSVLIKLKAGTFNGIEPVEIDFSADGSNSVYGIHWAPWSPDGYALGTGTSHGSCVPASACNFPVKLTLTNPVNGYFLDIKEISGGDTSYFADAPGHPWPYNATAGTPVSSPSTPASRPGPTTSASPWSVVSAYYADVNAGNYRAAWALMSSGWKATQGSYAHWKAGYAGSNDGHVSEVLQQKDYVTVTVTVPGQRTYHGWYQVDGGKITTAYLH